MKEKLIKHIVKFSVYPVSYIKLRRMEEEQLQRMADAMDANRYSREQLKDELLSYLD